MFVRHHAAISLGLAALLYAWLRSWEASLLAFVSGVLMDADHVLDYLIMRGPGDMRYQEMFRFFHEREYSRLYLILHGWEWLFLWGALWAAMGRPDWALGMAVGQGAHLVADQLTNECGPGGYSFLWRARHGFKRKAFFPKEG